jgi:hypothetical protein
MSEEFRSPYAAFYEDLAKAQAEIEGAKKDSANPHFRSKYADLASVWDAIREPLTKHGFCVTQELTDAAEGCVRLMTTLGHKSGQVISSAFSLKLKDPTNPQAAGSAITYMRRYALMAVTGVAPVDDDGNDAARPPATSPAAPKLDLEEVAAGLGAKWSKAKGDMAKMKAVYTEVKNSPLPPEAKTKLLTAYGEAITKAKNDINDKVNVATKGK